MIATLAILLACTSHAKDTKKELEIPYAVTEASKRQVGTKNKIKTSTMCNGVEYTVEQQKSEAFKQCMLTNAHPHSTHQPTTNPSNNLNNREGVTRSFSIPIFGDSKDKKKDKN